MPDRAEDSADNLSYGQQKLLSLDTEQSTLYNFS
jgi:hypothetical protein